MRHPGPRCSRSARAKSCGVIAAIAALALRPLDAGAAPPPAAAPPPPAAAPSEAERLTQEMEDNYRAGKYDAAAAIGERLLAMHTKTLGPDNPATADTVASLGAIYFMKGDYARAETFMQRAVTSLEKAHGPDHPDVLLRLVDLGSLYKERNDPRAEPTLLRAVAGYEKTLGQDDLRVAAAIYALAQLYKDRDDFARAEPLFLRALAVREKAAGADSLDVAKSLNDLANLYSDRGDYARAEPLHVRALAIAEKSLGPDHPQLAVYLNSFALTHKLKGDLAKAEPLYIRSLAIREKAGPSSPSLIPALQNLASLYKAKGDYGRAEPLYLRAVTIAEKVYGPEHPTTAIVLSSLGLLYRAAHDFDRAEPIYLRALAIREKTRGPDHIDVADSANNLGLLYAKRGDPARAEPLLRRALSIYEKKYGPEHPKVSIALDNLAGVARDRGDLELSRSLYLRSLAIAEKASGEKHPSTATALNNLAVLYIELGDLQKGEEAFSRALSIYEAAFGKDHPDVATALNNIGAIRVMKGDAKGAFAPLARSADMQDRHAALILTSGSEDQKRAYMDALRTQTFQMLNLQEASPATDPEPTRLALRTILRRKGRVLDAMAGSIAALRNRLDDGDRQLLDELANVQSRLARRILSGATTPEAKGEVASLEEKRNALESKISSRSAAFRAEVSLVSLEQIEAAIPEGAALIETFAFYPIDKKQPARPRFGAARYGAYVLRRGAPVRFVDLGDAEAINQNVGSLRTALSDPKRDPKASARALDALVMAPVRPHLGGARHLYISPDGALNLVPFSALIDESGRHLIENHQFTYLTSGRDLLRRGAPSPASAPPVIIANPDFGAKSAAGASSDGARGALRGVLFPPLPGTAEEASAIGKALGARVVEGPSATEEAIKTLRRPRILHLATHGFFLPTQQPTAMSGTRGLVLEPPSRAAEGLPENPLLRSGLAFASINTPKAGGDDGVLTALEAAGLDLHGTRLVVLSACETALGEARDGEGVYGLRRALVLSGSETQVMSLWKVDDEATRDLMVAYYKKLLAGGGRSEALREVGLQMLKSKGSSHPFYWASFIVSGSDAPLDPPSAPPQSVAPAPPGPRGCACSLPGEDSIPSNTASILATGAAIAALARRRRRAP